MMLDIPDRARFQWVPSLTSAPRVSMADPKFPYVKWRNGRPRSSQGAYARALGFIDADLRHPPHDENGRPVGAWFNLQEASDFPTNEDRKLRRRAALANCQKRLRSGSAPRSRIFWTTGANRPSSRRCRPPRNHPIASASPPSSTGRRRARALRRCVPRSAPPSYSAWPSPRANSRRSRPPRHRQSASRSSERSTTMPNRYAAIIWRWR
jgi:hypothetical protein